MKYELKNISQNIEVALVYIAEEPKIYDAYYIITEEILEQYNIKSETFISYLSEDMDNFHEDYEACNQLWAQNPPLYKLRSHLNTYTSLKNIKTVFTEEGDINLSKKALKD